MALVGATACTGGRQPGSRVDAGPVEDDAAAPVDSALNDAYAWDAGPPIDAPPPDNTCASVVVDTTPTTPNVVFVIDRSGSMSTLIDYVEPGAPRRWDALQDAMIGPDGIVTLLEDDVRFGAAMYSQDPSAPMATCPQMSAVPAIVSGRDAIQMLFDTNVPFGSTPTGDAIDRVRIQLSALAPSRADGPTYIVLATDGEPGTCADLTGRGTPTGRDWTLDRVRAAYDVGVETFVISVGDEIANVHLQDVANVGVGHVDGEPDAPYWVATDAAGLADALRTVVRSVVSCELLLDGSIHTDIACHGTVTLGGDTLECDTDWRPVDETHIEILGAACDRLQSGAGEELIATFPCDVLI